MDVEVTQKVDATLVLEVRARVRGRPGGWEAAMEVSTADPAAGDARVAALLDSVRRDMAAILRGEPIGTADAAGAPQKASEG